MAGVKYIAKTGINFDGLKGKPRVEVGKPIPEGVPEKEIAQLMASGAIEEVKEDSLSAAVRTSGNSLESLSTSVDAFQGTIKSAKGKE